MAMQDYEILEKIRMNLLMKLLKYIENDDIENAGRYTSILQSLSTL